MRAPTVLIACLKYSPLHNTLCRGLGEPLRAKGYRVEYLLPESLRWTVPASQREHVVFLGDSRDVKSVMWDTLAALAWRKKRLRSILRTIRPDLMLFESPHPANAVVARLARATLPAVKLWMLLHEPHIAGKSKHGVHRRVVISAQEWGYGRALRFLDGVIVPSREAFNQMTSRYPGFGGPVLTNPLLYEDQRSEQPLSPRYLSFIGHAVPAKGIDTFVEMVRESWRRGMEWEFQVATSTNVSRLLAGLPEGARKRLKVVYRPRLSDEAIHGAIRTSLAILAPYRRVTQSGVVPVAFMQGVPMIATETGAMPEHVIPEETGYLVPAEAPFETWVEAFERVRRNFDRLSANCRRFFEANFDARHGPRLLRPMLETIQI